MSDKAYMVIGGVYSDFTFSSLASNTNIETHGLYWSYSDAFDAWKKNAWLNVDNALHKLYISVVDFVENEDLD